MKQKYIVLSVHDVTPKFKPEIEEILDEFKHQGFNALNLCVVPNYEGLFDISKDEAFLSWLKDHNNNGHEIITHGYDHFSPRRNYSSFGDWFKGEMFSKGEAEFQNLTYNEAITRLKKGKEILNKGNIETQGFVPPCWILNKNGLDALKDLGFGYVVTAGKIRLLPSSEQFKAKAFFFASNPPIVSAAANAYDYYLEKVHLVNNELATIPIHPRNVKEGASFQKCVETVNRMRDEGRKLVTYKTFLKEKFNYE